MDQIQDLHRYQHVQKLHVQAVYTEVSTIN